MFNCIEVHNEQALPLKLEVDIERNDLEIYIGLEEIPSWSKFDYVFTLFGKEVSHPINYTMKELNKKLVYLTIFPKKKEIKF